jgi:hypothetical protein
MILTSLLVLTLCLPGTSFSHNAPEVGSLTTLWKGYIGKVRDGDLKGALSFWNEAERKRYLEESIFDWQTQQFLWQNKGLFLSLKDTLLSVEEVDGFTEVTISWKVGGKGSGFNEKRYLMKQGNRLCFVSPARFYDRKCLQRRVGHIIYYYLPGRAIALDKLGENEKYYSKLTLLFKLPKRSIDFYVVDSQTEVAEILGSGGYFGPLAFSNFGVVFSKNEYQPHEIAHSVLYPLSHRPIHFISEGSAAYLEPTSERRIARAKQYLQGHPDFDISSITDEKIFAAGKETQDLHYDLAASFVKYLITTYGIDKFKQLYSNSSTENGFNESVNSLSGRDMAQFSKEWKQYLLRES